MGILDRMKRGAGVVYGKAQEGASAIKKYKEEAREASFVNMKRDAEEAKLRAKMLREQNKVFRERNKREKLLGQTKQRNVTSAFVSPPGDLSGSMFGDYIGSGTGRKKQNRSIGGIF
jgi:hypothetical protein